MSKKKGETVEEVKEKSLKVQLTQKQLDELPGAVPAEQLVKGLIGDKRQYDSGSVGYNVNGKVIVGGLKCQVSCNVIVVGSKDFSRQKSKK